MGRNKRHEQVADMIQEEVSKRLGEFVQKEQFGLLTVTAVDVSDDFSYAKVWVSVLGNEASLATIKKALIKATPRLQKELNHVMYSKRVPKLKLDIDNSSEYVDEMDQIFEEIKNDLD